MTVKIIALLIIVIALLVVQTHQTKAASPSSYTYEYSNVNLYATQTLTMDFTGLDTNTQYTFSAIPVGTQAPFQSSITCQINTNQDATCLPTVGTSNGTQSSIPFYECIIGPGVTADSCEIGPDVWPQYQSFPFYIVDNFGKIISRHFLTYYPCQIDTTCAWQSNGATITTDEKIGIANVVTKPLNTQNPPTQHDMYDQAGIVTQNGDYTLLHYRIDSSTTPTDVVSIGAIGNPVGDFIGYKLSDFVDYNIPDGWLTFCECTDEQAYDSYIVLNTNSTYPGAESGGIPWINQPQSSYAFGADSNPMNTDFDIDCYAYYMVTSDESTLVAQGQSVWCVQTNTGPEWTLTITNDSIRPLEPMGWAYHSSIGDNVIYDDYPTQTLTDIATGQHPDKGTLSVSYIQSLSNAYATGNVITTTNTALSLTLIPAPLNYSIPQSAYEWVINQPYTLDVDIPIIPVGTQPGPGQVNSGGSVLTNLKSLIIGWGFQDGWSMMMFLALIFGAGAFGISALGEHASPMLYVLWWLICSLAFVFIGAFPSWLALIIVAADIAMIPAAMAQEKAGE